MIRVQKLSHAAPTSMRARGLVTVALISTILYLIYVIKKQSVQIDIAFEERRIDRIAAKTKAQELDSQYLSRLVADTSDGGSISRAILGAAEFKRSNYTAAIVLGNLKSQPARIQWVYDKLIDIEPRVYIVDDNETDGLHLEWNHGREAAVYFTYIVDNYDKLPDVTFFWHSDEIVWHNNLLMDWNSTVSLNRMDREHIMRAGYVPSRCDQWPGCPNWIRFNPSKAEHRLDPHRLEEMFNTEMFSEMFPQETEFPPFFAGTCCSQFAVSRDAIHRHSVHTYKRLLSWTMNLDNDDERSGRVFEYSWPYIFLGRGTHCPTMQECYCKTYNFCMQEGRDIIQLERWNALRTRREEFQWQLKFMENALETRYNISRDMGAMQSELDEIRETFRPEIERLASNLDNLTVMTWEAREEIVHYWKLSVPPVGW